MHLGKNDGLLMSMIYEHPGGHLSFSKDLSLCDVKDCNKDEDGFCIHRHDLHKILEDP
ncbi:hypothetical protein BH18THE2_BH18THE2_19440 [soil metagenome]